MVSALAQGLARTINLISLNAGHRFDLLISIGAYSLSVSRIRLMLVLTAVFLFELLLDQELLLDA